MYANYHTHTFRCHHANGTEREYIEQAIERGLHTLGFSDHAPYCFPDGYTSGFRMAMSEFDGYCRTLSDLKQAYKDDIELHIGLEMEYYPAYFAKTLERMKGYPLEYLILGQHFLENEQNAPYSGRAENGAAELIRYVDQTAEAMETGCYTYFAHPDLIRADVPPETYRHCMIRLCETAKRCGIPLELNLLGLGEHRAYPTEAFWSIVKTVGSDVVVGCDAHTPDAVANPAVLQEADDFLKRFDLTPLKTVTLRNPFSN